MIEFLVMLFLVCWAGIYVYAFEPGTPPKKAALLSLALTVGLCVVAIALVWVMAVCLGVIR